MATLGIMDFRDATSKLKYYLYIKVGKEVFLEDFDTIADFE